jgi:hypothetical protein
MSSLVSNVLGNKRKKKPMGQSRMDKTETLAILGTPNTGDRQTKLKNSIE